MYLICIYSDIKISIYNCQQDATCCCVKYFNSGVFKYLVYLRSNTFRISLYTYYTNCNCIYKCILLDTKYTIFSNFRTSLRSSDFLLNIYFIYI